MCGSFWLGTAGVERHDWLRGDNHEDVSILRGRNPGCSHRLQALRSRTEGRRAVGSDDESSCNYSDAPPTSSQSVPRPHPFFATLRFFGLTRGVGLARGARCGAGVVLVAVGLTTGTADLGDMVSLIMTLMILATQATGALIVPVGVLVLLTGNWYLRVLAAAFSIGLFAAVAGGVDFSP